MKTILITGAGKGIGLETAKLAAADGHSVIAISRNISALEVIEGVQAYSVDLSSEEAIHGFVKKIANTQIDVLINNAGVLTNTPVVESSFALFEKIYKVNVFGLAELTRQLLPQIPSSGHVVSISSMGGIQGSAKFPGLSIYSSSKGAVITLTELWAEEFKGSGPKFNVLALGAVQTQMLAEAFPGFEAPITAAGFAPYLLNFGLTGHQYYNGKTLQVSSSTP
ncbi:SDR family oxidoreductase [Flavobacteriaceae bacterium]|nr:SDR family oxidoreductase [Flavobacteriaceae bacterium]